MLANIKYRKSQILAELRAVVKNGVILLANLFQGSSSSFSCTRFPRCCAFQAGMWDTHISALLSSPTVAYEPGLSTAYENRGAIFRRITHEFGTHHDL